LGQFAVRRGAALQGTLFCAPAAALATPRASLPGLSPVADDKPAKMRRPSVRIFFIAFAALAVFLTLPTWAAVPVKQIVPAHDMLQIKIMGQCPPSNPYCSISHKTSLALPSAK
jgi:hypothetical protein